MQNALTMTIPGNLADDSTEENVQRSGQSSADSVSSEFAALVHQHSRLIFRIVMTVYRNPHDAEDVVQETFLQLYRVRSWQQIADHRSYLARVAWRLAIRRRSKPQEELPNWLPSLASSPEDQVIDQQFEARIHTLIGRLPEKLRQPLALSALGELKLVEIAAILGLPEGTVRRRIHTARQKLKQQMAVVATPDRERQS